ncbi:sensor domain-containing diguanylate cyclase [Kineococcus auxinigenes]|uniref:sensor domain-containing diguanylate cyclase n=1 Tax=unclassified Kineococcus TaxID=2621656 RepID=UPI003D7EBCBA
MAVVDAPVVPPAAQLTAAAAPGAGGAELAGYLAGAPDPCWSTGPDGLVTSWNPAAERVLGVTAADALGRCAAALLGAGTGARAGSAPEPGDAPTSREVLLTRPDGLPVCGVLTRWSAPPGSAPQHHHVLRVHEGASSPRDGADLLGRVSDSVVVTDLAGTVVYANAGAERLWGPPAREVVGRRVGVLTRHSPDLEGDFRSLVDALSAGGTWSRSAVPVVTAAGRDLLVDVGATALVGADGACTGVVLVSRDVTGERQLERSLREATRALRERAVRLADASRRDPLTGLAGRSLLQERLAAALTAARADEGPVSVLRADLRGFRAVNDSYGWVAGDALLISFTAHLLSLLPAGATVGRWGADEFVAVLPDSSAAAADDLAGQVAGWAPPAPLPGRGRRRGDRTVGVVVRVVRATPQECSAPFDGGVRALLQRAEAAVAAVAAAQSEGSTAPRDSSAATSSA